MRERKNGKSGHGEVTQERDKNQDVISPHANRTSMCCKEKCISDASVDINFGATDMRLFLKQVVGEAIRDFFLDPHSSHIIMECVNQHSDKLSVPLLGSRRDISNDEIIRPRDLPQVTGLSRTNIWRIEKAGQFVKKIRLSNGCVGYSAASIREWVANRQIIKGGNHETK